LEWETFTEKDGLPDLVVFDIAVEGDIVYFATANGLAEYDINFEKWRYYGQEDGIPSDTIRFIYQTRDFLWLFTDQGPGRFTKNLHTTLSFSYLPELRFSYILDLLVENNNIWLATQDGVFIYDLNSNIWRNFQEENNLPSRHVNALIYSQDERWFITQKGVAVKDEKINTWQRYDKTHGLSSIIYNTVAVYKGNIFLINHQNIDYFKSTENRWIIFPIKDIAGVGRVKTPFISLDRKRGSFIQLNPHIKFGISGTRSTFLSQGSHQYQNSMGHLFESSKGIHRSDLKGQLSFYDKRSINGFYNNTDFSQVLYGIKYKGIKGDLFQEVNWGDTRYEQGKNYLIPSIGIFGVSTKLEAGPKTKRYKRSLISAAGWSGEKTTGAETEFFTGNYTSSEIYVKDTDYIKNIYFKLDTVLNFFRVEKGTEKVYIDDGNILNNTKNTIEEFVIDDVAGDFDFLHPYIDYTIDYETGIIQFIKPVNESALIAIQFVSEGKFYERIIKKPYKFDYMLSNYYFTGGIEIIPSSLILKILDYSDNNFLLSEFGIDSDNNGFVDPEWIDYKQGILVFPDLNPFPNSVYNINNPTSSYRLEFQFDTEIQLFNLKHRHLIRGSEAITVDGEVLIAGQDYVLDYTSGSLLIIKEGIMAEDSEIEVDYEYYILYEENESPKRENFHCASLGFGPSDNILLETKVYSFDKRSSNIDHLRYYGYNFMSEIKWRLKNVDFKITPEFARTHGKSKNGNSLYLRTDISSQKIRLFSVYEKYDPEFQPLFPKKFKLGKLQDRIFAGATYYFSESFDIRANWKKQRTPNQLNGKKYIEEDFTGKILFSQNLYPAISVFARKQDLNTETYRSTKRTIKGDMEYQIPYNLLKKISLKSIRVYAVWRRSWEEKNEFIELSRLSVPKKTFDNHYIRLDISPADLVQINTYYRGENVKNIYNKRQNEDHLSNKKQKLFFDTIIDRLPGININIRYQGDVTEYFPINTSRNPSFSIHRFLQTNFRFFPGKWLRILTPFTFEFNYQPDWRGYLRNADCELNFSEKFWLPSTTDNLVSSNDQQMIQFRCEWRPSATLFFYTGIEQFEINSQYNNSYLKTNIKKLNQKVEVRPSINSLLTIQYLRNYEEKIQFSELIRDNPMIWFETRWNEKLQTRLNFVFWREEEQKGQINELSSNFSSLFGFVYRFGSSGVSRAEIKNDFSVSSYRSKKTYFSSNYNSYSNSLSFDYFPVSVLILRFRLTSTYTDNIDSTPDSWSNFFEFRLTAQF
jgi:hypothetical protein